ncbi:MAG: hypothetical protein GY948_05610 [Alphaproteobacteria bacterium]|nr:hypothetical protein [Alphaproteobacteria bacterium]
MLTEPYATGLATIKAIKRRIGTARSEHKTQDVDVGTEISNQPCTNSASPADDHVAETLAPCFSLAGRLADGESGPNDHWKAYSKKYREEHDKEQPEKQIDGAGLEACRFELIDIDRAWWQMKVGDVPDAATKIWETLEIELPVHLIADDVQITNRECMFWLTVFKRHLDVQEAKQSGRVVYSRDPDQADLSSAVEQKVRSLH